MMSCYDGNIRVPDVVYNRKFAVRDLAVSIEGLLKLSTLDAGRAYRKAVFRAALEQLDGISSVSDSEKRQIIAEIAAPESALRELWAQTAEIEQYDVAPTDGEFFRCALTPRAGADLRTLVFSLVREQGWALRELTRNRHSLEDIYVQVTQPGEDEEE